MRENRARLIRVMQTLNKIDSQYYHVQRELGIKESLFVLFYMCADGQEHTQKSICDEWYIPRTTLNTTVKEQEAAGRIELIPCGNKQKSIRLTESGRTYAESFLGPLLDAEERASSAIDNELIAKLEQFDKQLEREFNALKENES